jgi:integrase
MIKRVEAPRPWEARGRDEKGRQYRKRFLRKKDAERFEQEVEKRKERRRLGLPAEQPHITYAELVERYLAQYERTSKKWFGEMLQYSLKEFGEVLVRDLRSEEIARWLNELSLRPKTKKHILDSMRQVLTRGVEWGYVGLSPARPSAVPGPAQPAPDVDPFRSWEQVEAIARQVERQTDAAAIRFACATGLRPEEWAALTFDDVDFRNRTVSVNKVWVKGSLRTDRGKTDSSFRTVALQQRAIDALTPLPRPIDGSALVFPAPGGGYIDLNNWRRRVWRRAMDKSGVRYRPPGKMRHTYATLALAAGATLDWIGHQLGHSDLRVTNKYYARYVKAVDDRQIALLDSFSAESDPLCVKNVSTEAAGETQCRAGQRKGLHLQAF